MKKPPRTTKKTRAARTAFVQALVGKVIDLGGRGAYADIGFELFDGPVWEGTLATLPGELKISIYPNGIDTNASAMCRFTGDLTLVAGFLPMVFGQPDAVNPYSGKWNHHYFGDWSPDTAAFDLERQLRKVLKPIPKK